LLNSYRESAAPAGINVDRIQGGIAKGRSAKDLARTEDHRAIETSLNAVAPVYRLLRERLDVLFTSLSATGIDVVKLVDKSVDEFANSISSPSLWPEETELYRLDFGRQSGPLSFYVKVCCRVAPPNLGAQMSARIPPNTSSCVYFYLRRYGGGRDGFPQIAQILTFANDGHLFLRDEAMNLIEQINVEEVVERMKEWAEDDHAWEMIQGDR